MRIILTFFTSFLLIGVVSAQTNIFPKSGNVGIGTIKPRAKLSFNNLNDGTNEPDGITWYSPASLDYGIYRTAGSWSAPNYQQLRINFITGIILNPGTDHVKSYVDIQGGGLRVTSGNAGIGITFPTEKLDIAGSIRIRTIAQNNTLNRILAADANGKVFWRDAATMGSGSGGGWSLTGNGGTMEGVNFIGTTDNVPLTFRVNNQQAGWIGSAANGSVFLGYQAGNVNTASYNIGIGLWSLFSNTTGSNNTASGVVTLYSNTSGFSNTATGCYALYSNTTGYENTAAGSHALYSNTTGNSNTVAGSFALYSNTTGSYNTTSGHYALYSNTTGSYNTASGHYALHSNTTGSYNTATGTRALNRNTGSYNTSTGSYALYNNTIGSSNTANGYYSLQSNTTGSNNTATGIDALFHNTTGNNNTATGIDALFHNTTGNNNTAFGNQALYNNTSGSYNTAIGYNARVPYGSGISNSTAIGANAVVNVSNAIVLGNNVVVGIAQNSPTRLLEVAYAYCDGWTWHSASDKVLKENFAEQAPGESVLEKVMALPVQYWNYKGETGARHLGPTAQDFYAAFGLGDNEKAIASVDEAGVALAAIQELAKKTEKLEQLIETQQQLIAALLSSKTESPNAMQEPGRGIELHQNIPNPFHTATEIRMTIPGEVREAVLYVYDIQGRLIKSEVIAGRGSASVYFEGGTLNAGIYFYMLVADGRTAGMKRMILTE